MQIQARSQGFEITDSIAMFIRQSSLAALQRFREDVHSIELYLKDVNGPRGGVDKKAVVRVRLSNGQHVAVTTTHENLYGAIKDGIKRCKRNVRRSLKKTKQISRRSHRDYEVELEATALS